MYRKIVLLLLMLQFFNCEEIIAVEDISEENIIILAPSNDATLFASTINFSWQPLEYADQYQIQIATPSFEASQQIIEDTIVTVATYTKMLSSDNYQWRVKAINFAYETSYNTQNLTIEE
jgi:hypothetical protein